MNFRKLISIILISISLYVFFIVGNTFVPIEALGIPAIIGADIEMLTKDTVKYKLQSSVYNYSDNKLNKNFVLEGEGNTIGKTREDRQLQESSRFLPGLEKVMVIGEAMANYSITNLIDILFATETVTDNTLCLVCKGESKDIVNFPVDGYSNSGDYIEGMVRALTTYNFFSNNYKLMDIYVRLDSEGRNVVLPFIEIKDNKLKINGMSVFKKDKLVTVLDIYNTKLMNILREKNVMGILSIQKSSKEYVDFYAKSKRKVSCVKKEDGYIFNIDIKLSGDVISNNIYYDFSNSPDKIEAFEKEMSDKIEKMCKEFISKMQNQYKTDMLELGRVAAAKYGRNSGVDWNEIVSKSKINVSVNTTIKKFGRGDY